VGDHAILARRSGDKWFVGAIQGTDHTQHHRLRLDFLPAGRTFKMKAFVDGVNADYQAMHYNVIEQEVTSATELDVTLMRNGGFAAVIE
jgi:alpha-glucosidase